MDKIHFATMNEGKVDSLAKALSRHGIEVVHVPLELSEPRSYDLREIARHKVLSAYEQIMRPCVALDSGFYISSLNGFPRTFVNFALETIGIEGILDLVKRKGRSCEFRNCLAYYDDALEEPRYFESRTAGTLAHVKRGEMEDHYWSELFLVFIPDGRGKTLAEMTSDEYRQWRRERHDISYTSGFGEWFSER